MNAVDLEGEAEVDDVGKGQLPVPVVLQTIQVVMAAATGHGPQVVTKETMQEPHVVVESTGTCRWPLRFLRGRT